MNEMTPADWTRITSLLKKNGVDPSTASVNLYRYIFELEEELREAKEDLRYDYEARMDAEEGLRTAWECSGLD